MKKYTNIILGFLLISLAAISSMAMLLYAVDPSQFEFGVDGSGIGYSSPSAYLIRNSVALMVIVLGYTSKWLKMDIRWIILIRFTSIFVSICILRM